MLPENDEIRTALLQSGKQQFLAHGFDRASLRVICRNANVTTGAFYSHFEKKEDLFAFLLIFLDDNNNQVLNLIYEFYIHLALLLN